MPQSPPSRFRLDVWKWRGQSAKYGELFRTFRRSQRRGDMGATQLLKVRPQELQFTMKHVAQLKHNPDGTTPQCSLRSIPFHDVGSLSIKNSGVSSSSAAGSEDLVV